MMQATQEKTQMPESGLSKQILRLELADQLLAAQDEITSLKQQLEQQATSQPGSDQDPIQVAITALQQFQYIKQELEASVAREIEQAAEIDRLKNTCEERAEMIKKQYAAANKIKDQREHYKGECDKLLKKHNTEVDKANVTITRLQAQLNASRAEVKELKALNPDRLQKQVKRLQEKNRELNEGNQKLREQVNLNRKAGQALIDMKERNLKLEKDNARLHAALDEAVNALNRGHQPKSIKTIDGWEIFGSTDSEDILIIRDPKTGIERPCHRANGILKARAVPPAVLKQIGTLFERMDQIRDHFDIGQERVA